MKKTETPEQTLVRLARNARKGASANKRFTSLVRRMIKTPPRPRVAAKKPTR